ncbi:hypothetical protein SAMN02745194_02690 [Roseomonas rosea]|uniref:Uncharacterized protein n=1 Tax=Muricoccus roseus TaxID=198092 RepID=A0A1M6JNT3_9PROT|nr:hypothetical protein [Roseomonas rosea]SHJ48223.1 hypothetical protein SAMN02745194_02690 [Roseomonas rosea]
MPTAYAIPFAPEATPSVAPRALLRAWDTAREAATAALEGPPRAFRFQGPSPKVPALDLLLEDRDACCWAEALDRRFGLDHAEGLAILLRLLALLEVMGRAPWMRGLFDIGREGTVLHPDLLRAAATEPLDGGARFDEEGLRHRLARPRLTMPNETTGATPA